MKPIAKLSAVLMIAVAASTSSVAAPQTYAVDSTHTFPRFSYSHFGMSTQLSRFDKTSGIVKLDTDAETGEVEVTIDMRSVDTGYATFDEHIQGPEFLNTTAYPTATFKSTHVAFKDGRPAKIHGDLTIKGITKPVSLTVTNFVKLKHPLLNKDAIGADAVAVINRSDFNAAKYAPNVGDQVTINISLEAIAN